MPEPPESPARSGRAPTIYTVAEVAGVSHQTVSRFLKGEALRPANRLRVEQAMASLDFQVNDDARALATSRPRRIGAFVFEVDDWAPQRVLAGAAEAARAAGYILDIVRVDVANTASIDQAVRLMNRTTLAGVVVISPSDPVLEQLNLQRLRVPWVVEAEPEVPDDSDAALTHPFAKVMDHLMGLGHRRFFHVGGPDTWLAARNRRATYRAFVRRYGLTDCGQTEGDWGAAWGYAAMASSPLDAAPTAITAASDQLALGVLHWLHEHGVRVPEDVSVTGYDGIPDTAYFWPSLTTVSVDFAEQGRRTVEALLRGEARSGRPDPGRPPAAELVPRASTGVSPH